MGAVMEELIRGYADLRRVLRRDHSADDAADIAQSSFEHALRYAQQNEVLSPASLLFVISRHLQIDAARRKKRAPECTIEDDAHFEYLAVCEVTPERQHSSRQRVELLSNILDNLAPGCREAFVLCKIHGMSYDEAASEMGISSTVVKKYIVQALKELRNALR
ncbi:RNA polymerase sigma-70 factor, ECF subfamily [Candidatus Burkholderia verschuerenii]|uniref:RNA polymerase sigma-70 factor, ECF subfamily n=1 Tax=Candidatus Burkholderia verschuerenii TaxID=242163 RepID=A0A0L0M6T5_9BURK|nr:RNA polymerase sigma factor [Candidatus Burkholderia verschuerenii]KND57664.1 RNA polymerase sigma-70 factor, ECF subfamily [Candidatus Burkholderia verschuerenii]